MIKKICAFFLISMLCLGMSSVAFADDVTSIPEGHDWETVNDNYDVVIYDELVVFDGSESWNLSYWNSEFLFFYIYLDVDGCVTYQFDYMYLTGNYRYLAWPTSASSDSTFINNNNQLVVFDYEFSTLTEWTDYLSECYIFGNPIILLYISENYENSDQYYYGFYDDNGDFFYYELPSNITPPLTYTKISIAFMVEWVFVIVAMLLDWFNSNAVLTFFLSLILVSVCLNLIITFKLFAKRK